MKSFLLILWLHGVALVGAAAVIEVTDAQGRSMTVEVLSYTASSGNVKIKRTDGQQFQVKLDIFDAASQKKIIENAPVERAKMLIRVSVGKRRSRQGDSSYMKDQTISASITVENDSRDIDFRAGKGTLFLIARQTKRYSDRDADYGKVLSKEEYQVTVDAGEEFTYEAKPVVTSYDSDRDSTNIGGWEYYGYLFLLQNEDGSVHSAETSIGNLETEIESSPAVAKKLLKLAKEELVEKNLEKR
ncbi:MAG: hypothetical protein AAGA96_04210 [Verrucomicrobiota bacterium]